MEKTIDRQSTVETADVEPDHRWVIRVWLLVAAFTVIMLARSWDVGIPFRDPDGRWFRFKLAYSLGVLAVLALLEALVSTRSAGWSVRRSLTRLRERWWNRRLVLAVTALVGYHIVYVDYRNLKSWDVFNHVRDGMLESWDRWLFFGHSPAVLLHDALGQGVSAHVLRDFYESFPTLVWIAFTAALVFCPRMRHGYVAIASAMWVWILGTATYYLIPSLGPFNESPQDFAGLPHMSIQDTQAKYMAQRDYLLSNPHAHDATAQISAFASLHTGVTFVVVLLAFYYGLRRPGWVLTAYLVVIMISTVYLGWHFFVDDIAGLAIGFLSVYLGKRMIYPHGRPEPDDAPVG